MRQDAPHCCDPDCDRPAEFGIYGESGHPEDVTEACVAHVGELLGTPQWLPGHNLSWTVAVITEEG